MKMNRLHALRKASGVLSFPIPNTCSPCSRSRLANRAKSLSEETSTNPSNRPVCIRSIASITNAMSDEFFPFVYANCWWAITARPASFFSQLRSCGPEKSP